MVGSIQTIDGPTVEGLGFATFDNDEIASMQGAIDAVCAELGVRPGDRARREAIATRVIRSFAGGRRQPLNLVNAGLES